MGEYVKDKSGDVWRAVYIVFFEGDEIAAFLDKKAAEEFADMLEAKGVNANDVWVNYYVQPIEDANWFCESMNLKPYRVSEYRKAYRF